MKYLFVNIVAVAAIIMGSLTLFSASPVHAEQAEIEQAAQACCKYKDKEKGIKVSCCFPTECSASASGCTGS